MHSPHEKFENFFSRKIAVSRLGPLTKNRSLVATSPKKNEREAEALYLHSIPDKTLSHHYFFLLQRMTFFRKIISCGKDPEPSLYCDFYQLDANGRLSQSQVPVTEIPPKYPANSSEEDYKNKRIVRFVVVSDTHELHHTLHCPSTIPNGDVFLHCGDILLSDRMTLSALSKKRIRDFFRWVNQLPHKTKIVIAGNHDKEFEKCGVSLIKSWASPAIYAEHELIELPITLDDFPTATTTPGPVGTRHERHHSDNRAAPETQQRAENPSSSITTTAPLKKVLLRCLASPWSFGHSPNKAFQGDESTETLLKLARIMGEKEQHHSQEVGKGGSTTMTDEALSLPALHVVMTHLAGNCRDLRTALHMSKASLHFGGHYHEHHGATKIGGVPSFNAAMLRGKFGREELQNVTVVDIEL